MLFMTYWELNENMSAEQRLKIAQRLTSSGKFPPKGVNVLRFDLTPDEWGSTIYEADKAEDVFREVDIWRTAGARSQWTSGSGGNGGRGRSEVLRFKVA